MKRFLNILVVFMLILGLSACSNNTDNTSDPDPTPDLGPTPEQIACQNDDAFVDYIIHVMKDIAESEYALYQSTIGDITAPQLTVADIEENEEAFKENIKMSISNPDIVPNVEVADGMKIYTYGIERILVVNGTSTHMGAGIPGYVDFDYETGNARYTCELGE